MIERAQIELLYDGSAESAHAIVAEVIGEPYQGPLPEGQPILMRNGLMILPGDTLMRENFGTEDDPAFYHAVRRRTLH